ncbi:hypothetical protein Q672_10805 [Marinobacter sp. EVN1]|uniref:outer membrane protein n=1 Tax=Marinobacter sp. EVN1 TaxID=1397532 RepID=UPI0003B8CF91|nr:hypothetical protein [Marinobacter sp. EVN1]ERS88338.1 hypothetical protein Q672_10805 [Marinobacter sp. EVN1]
MKRKMIAGAMLASIVVPQASADLWDIDTSAGVSPAVMIYESKEPEGTTPTETAVYPLTLTATFDINRINRVMADFRYVDIEFDAGDDGVGATVEGYQLSTILQHQFRLSRNFRPWLGVGVVSTVFESTDRYRTDGDGFLLERYDDRDDTTLSGVANAALEWELSRDWILATEARYELPFGDGLQGYGVSAGVRYKF